MYTDLFCHLKMSAFTKPDIKAVNAAGVLAFEASGLAAELLTAMASTVAATANEVIIVIMKWMKFYCDRSWC